MGIKEEILSFLENHRDGYLSGQEIADKLHVSRMYVWKNIKALEEQGYVIKAVQNRGYQLAGSTDILSKQGIAAYLQSGAWNVEVFDVLDSTNAYAKAEALKGAKHQTVIVAKAQTAGRGRQGRSFFSPKDTGIYMSIILRPKQEMEQATLATITAAVAVCRAIESLTALKPQIKWVNDIYVQGKKVCGILTEGTYNMESGVVENIIVGIGINVNTQDFPMEIADVAGSLGSVGGMKNHLVAQILTELSDLKQAQDILTQYRSRSMVLGMDISYMRENQRFYAKAVDISDTGGLIVISPDGEKSILKSGEISIDKEFLNRL